MDILIKGLALPKKGEVMKLYLCSDGDVGYDDDGKPYKTTAIELSPHGRLIDRDAIIKRLDRSFHPDSLTYTIAFDIAKEFINNAPTILEANYGSDN